MQEKIVGSAISLVLFFLLMFGYTKLAGPFPLTINSVSTTKTDTFNAGGEGKVFIRPDTALVSLGISATAGSVRQVQEQIHSVIDRVSQEVKSLGIDEKDIKTTNYSINPNYDYNSGSQKITGYQASTNLQVKVKDIDKVNDVIDRATAAGANQVGGISFDVDDRTKAENEAREKAVEEAKRKAKEAAKIAGFRLGKIINYQENVGAPWYPQFYQRALKAEGGGASTQVEPGSSEVSVTVTISFEIF